MTRRKGYSNFIRKVEGKPPRDKPEPSSRRTRLPGTILDAAVWFNGLRQRDYTHEFLFNAFNWQFTEQRYDFWFQEKEALILGGSLSQEAREILEGWREQICPDD